MNWPLLLLIAETTVRSALVIRIVIKRRNVSETLAWLGVLLLLPVGGIVLYLWFGERSVANRGSRWESVVTPHLRDWLHDVQPRAVHNWSNEQLEERGLSELVNNSVGLPPIRGNELRLMESMDDISDSLVADIQQAQQTCFLEFYIWESGGRTDRLVEALTQATSRGVDCRLLLDDVGSHRFLKGRAVRELRERGIKVQSAFPVGLIASWFHRFDLRLHRKIIVIDGLVGYTGSQNMVDPVLFKQRAGVGQWVDAMVRIEGEVVEGLLAIFLGDWHAETGEGIELLSHATEVTPVDYEHGSIVQVIPSGPTLPHDVAKQIIVSTIFAAKKQLILTTPYYVPDQTLQLALVAAARRGVDVTLIVPNKVDSKLVALASEPYQIDLLRAGVRVMLHQGGLLHTKSISVDDRISVFGSLNLDLRSLYLNFEISLAVYDPNFTHRLRRLQQSYMQASVNKKLSARRMTLPRLLLEGTVRLIAPLL